MWRGRGGYPEEHVNYLCHLGHIPSRMLDKDVLHDPNIELHRRRTGKSDRKIDHSTGRLYETGGTSEWCEGNLYKIPVLQSNRDTATILVARIGNLNISWMQVAHRAL